MGIPLLDTRLPLHGFLKIEFPVADLAADQIQRYHEPRKGKTEKILVTERPDPDTDEET